MCATGSPRQPGGASAAYAEFGRFLETELAPLGREREAVGRERYALESRRFLGATIDLEETYAWGWEELKRLSDDMAATADRILPGATVAEAVAHLDADPSTKIVGKEAFRDWMQDLADRTLAELDGRALRHPRARSAGSSAASRPPTTAASTTPAPRRTSSGPAGCGGRSPTGRPSSVRGGR